MFNKQLRPPLAGKTGTAVFIGDYCPRNEGQELIHAGQTESIIEAVKPFITAGDLKIIQWETPLTSSGQPICKSGPNLICSPESADIVDILEIDLALLANNHIGDQGGEAVMETIRHLRAAGSQVVGAGCNLKEAAKPVFLECNGIRIAVLNRCEHEFGIAGRDTIGSAPLSILKDLKAIRENLNQADQVWITIHGGHEVNPFPSPQMQETYRAFAEAGAALVFNCHTHCPEGIEIWNGTPIIYSPGNFYFPRISQEMNTWRLGYLPRLSFDKQGIYDLEIMPYTFDNYKMYSLDEEKRKEFFEYFNELCAALADPELIQRYFDCWSVIRHEQYLKVLAGYPEFPKPFQALSFDDRKKWLPLRNIFTCEAHAELFENFLRLIEDQKQQPSEADLDYLTKLQKPSCLRNNHS